MHTYIAIIKFNFQIKHSKKLTTPIIEYLKYPALIKLQALLFLCFEAINKSNKVALDTSIILMQQFGTQEGH